MEVLGCLDLEFPLVAQLPGFSPWLFLGGLYIKLVPKVTWSLCRVAWICTRLGGVDFWFHLVGTELSGLVTELLGVCV